VTIEQRLEAVERHTKSLEKKVNRYRKAMVVIAVLWVAGVTLAQAKPEVSDELRCRKLVIVNEQGKSVARFGVFEKSPALVLYNSRHVAGLTLGMIGDAPYLSMHDAQKKLRLSLRVFNGPTLNLNDAEGESLISLNVLDDNPALRLNNAQGKTGVGLSVIKGSPLLSLNNAEGKSLVGLFTTGIGGSIRVSNKTCESIATLYPDDYGNGVVVAWNRKGKGSGS